MIAVAWGNILNIYSISNTLSFDLYRSIELKYDIIGVQWMGGNVLFVLNDQHQGIIVDSAADDCVSERISLKAHDILFHQIFSQMKREDRVTSYNEMEHLKQVTPSLLTTFHHSLTSCNGSIFILVSRLSPRWLMLILMFNRVILV